MRHVLWSFLAAGVTLAGAGTIFADDDTVRLGGAEAQASIYSGGIDIDLVRGGGGGHGGGGHGGVGHAGYGGGRGYGYGGYGRGFGYGGYGRGYGYGYGRGFGYGFGFGGYYGGYYPAYYYPYYYAPTYYYPIAGDSAPTMTLQATPSNYYAEPNFAPQPNAQPMRPAGNGPFPYDGGPRAPIPMPAPGIDNTPASQPRPVVPIDGKLASLATQPSGGFAPVTTPDIQRLRYVSTPASTQPTRIVYPAYGE